MRNARSAFSSAGGRGMATLGSFRNPLGTPSCDTAVSIPCDKAARKPLEASWEGNASNVEGAPQAAPEPTRIVAAHRTATVRHRDKGSVFMIAARVAMTGGDRTLLRTLARTA